MFECAFCSLRPSLSTLSSCNLYSKLYWFTMQAETSVASGSMSLPSLASSSKHKSASQRYDAYSKCISRLLPSEQVLGAMSVFSAPIVLPVDNDLWFQWPQADTWVPASSVVLSGTHGNHFFSTALLYHQCVVQLLLQTFRLMMCRRLRQKH